MDTNFVPDIRYTVENMVPVLVVYDLVRDYDSTNTHVLVGVSMTRVTVGQRS